MKRKFIFGFIIIFLAGYCLHLSCSFSTKENKQLDIVKNISKRPDLTYTAKQKRNHLTKEIWFNKGKNRLQAYLTAEKSDLIYNQDRKEKEVLENLSNVLCYIQEKQYFHLNEPRQDIRLIEANDARFFYNSNTLIAQKVKVKLYTKPGHTLDLSLDDATIKSKLEFDQLEIKL